MASGFAELQILIMFLTCVGLVNYYFRCLVPVRNVNQKRIFIISRGMFFSLRRVLCGIFLPLLSLLGVFLATFLPRVQPVLWGNGYTVFRVKASFGGFYRIL